jgi:hypothetical protein
MAIHFDGEPAADLGASGAAGSGATGSAADVGAKAAADGDTGGGCPTCGGAKSKKKKKHDTEKALQKQRAMLLDKKESLDRWDAQDRADAKKWFGSDDLETRATLTSRVNGELGLNQQMMNNPDMIGDGTRQDIGIGYVGAQDNENIGGGPGNQRMYLTGAYDSLPLEGDHGQVNLMTHEMSHFAENGGLLDTRYGPEASLALAQSNPGAAMQNADNFAGWVNH